MSQNKKETTFSPIFRGTVTNWDVQGLKPSPDGKIKIRRNQVTTWFPIDLITIIPFDIIELASGADHMGAFKGTKAIRALRRRQQASWVTNRAVSQGASE